MTPQHPAAPEGETDASGKVALTEAEWLPVEDRLIALWQCETEAGYDEMASRVERAVERIVAERLRVVEGERDAAMADTEGDRERQQKVTENPQEFLMWTLSKDQWRVVAECLRVESAALTARAESAEAAHANTEADYDRRGERLWRLAAKAGYTPCESDNDATAEMAVADALAAHAALVAGVEALADEYEVAARAALDDGTSLADREVKFALSAIDDLRALLPASDREGGGA